MSQLIRLSLASAISILLVACGGGGSPPAPPPPPPVIVIDAIPTFGGVTINDKTYTRGVAIADETLPAASGGDGALTYSISPSLPAGISFDASTRVLSGTPTTVQQATSYTYRVTDSDSTDPDSATLTFAITVNEPIRASIEASVGSVDEWKDAIASVITITLDAAAPTMTAVELSTSGSATCGSDYDLVVGAGSDSRTTDCGLTLAIAAEDTSASVSLYPIRDLAEEGAETATIAIASVGGVTPADEANSVNITIVDTGQLAAPPDPGDEGEFADIAASLDFSVKAETVELDVRIYNAGSVTSSATKGYVEARTSPYETEGAIKATPNEVDIGSLSPAVDEEDARLQKFTLALNDLSTSQNYYILFVVVSVPEEFGESGEPIERAGAEFHIGDDGTVRTTCTGFNRSTNAGVVDPLLEDQWQIRNTGQTAHAESGGVADEDLRMSQVLANGPTGDDVTVAIVDSGLEICHPDLAPNVEAGLSFNFIADLWHGAKADDPFLPSLLEGDHGTSVAGLVAMAADNGVGGRGIAPDAGLRGFNLLALAPYFHLGGEYDLEARELDALGMSSANPRSNDVDIFNMSYGGAYGASKLGIDKRNTFHAGVTQLRTNDGTNEPLGAIYVLASGNSFNECDASPDVYDEKQLALFLNAEIGCVSANLDPEAAWPYVIDVGAFNADGKRSSYSSVGSSIWVVAPGGEDAFSKPASISADQMGLDRGYATEAENEDLGTNAKNPDGDYTYAFGGTSAAAPNASGAIAVLLSAAPNLTWRDVKHILATTARPLEPDIRQTRVAFGGKPAVLQHAWITNAAGYRFHNHFGFGAIHIDDAVEMARSMTANNLGPFVQSESFDQSLRADIPDHDGAGVTLMQSVSGLPASVNIEAVQVGFQITHPRPHDLGLTLVSPSGTPSVVNHVLNGALAEHPDSTLDWELLSNAFYGESPNGDWEFNVIDVVTGEVGQVESWSLVFFYGQHPSM